MITVFPKGIREDFHLQKTFVGLNFLWTAYKYVAIPLTENVKCVTLLVPKSEIPDEFGYAHWAVFQYSTLTGFLDAEKRLAHPVKIDVKNIRIFNGIVDAKEIEISLVLSKSQVVGLWKTNFAADNILRNVLSFFCISHSCIIVIPEQSFNQSGIKYICVHNTGSRKSVSRITDTTIIKVRDTISANIFEHLHSDGSTFQVEALDDQTGFLNFVYNAHLHEKSRSNSVRKLIQKVLLCGPSGCGKTRLVKHFVELKKCGLIIVEAWKINYLPAGKLEKTLNAYFAEAVSLSKEKDDVGCILLFDEMESLCKTKRQGLLFRQGIPYMIKRFLEIVDDYPGLLVIGTTNNIESLHSHIRCATKMEIELHIGPPNEQERSRILQMYCNNFKIATSDCQKIANFTPGFSGADLNSLVRNAARIRSTNPALYRSEKNLLKLFKKLALKKPCSALRVDSHILSSRAVEMKHLGGLNSVKQCLKMFVEWPLLFPEAFYRLGLPIPKGILLYGPPGCAKTSLARAIANSSNMNFLCISAAELYSSYVGEAEKNVIALFDKARVSQPCIIFIDEIDTLAGNRNTSSKNVQSKILSTFLTEMDGVGNKLDIAYINKVIDDNINRKKVSYQCVRNVVLVAATNRPDKLDSALLRPGRFDKLIFVGPPDWQERIDILKSTLQHWRMPTQVNVDLAKIADKTENFTGADLKLLLKEAGYAALIRNQNAQQIDQEDLETGLQAVQPSSASKFSNFYESFR